MEIYKLSEKSWTLSFLRNKLKTFSGLPVVGFFYTFHQFYINIEYLTQRLNFEPSF